MSEFFKRNIYIYVYIYVLCFVTGQNAKDLDMILTYGDIQMNFTIYKNNPIAEFFYEKSKQMENLFYRYISHL